MSVGIKIKRLREQHGMNQSELAAILDIEQSSLSKMESEKIEKFDFILMDKICKIFKKDISHFLSENSITNNVETNNGIVVNEGIINNHFPNDMKILIQKVLETHQKQSKDLFELQQIILKSKSQN